MIAITGGLVLDGTGSEPVAATVVVDGDRIADVLSPTSRPADSEVIDASGNIVAPGFIDLHSHADFSVRTSPGAVADLVVLDPSRVADRSTYDDPWQLSVGIEHMLVAGQQVLADGVPTGKRPGRVLT